MSRKDELLMRIKNIAITPEDYKNSVELIKLMNYYNVHGLYELSLEQVEDYLEHVLQRGDLLF